MSIFDSPLERARYGTWCIEKGFISLFSHNTIFRLKMFSIELFNYKSKEVWRTIRHKKDFQSWCKKYRTLAWILERIVVLWLYIVQFTVYCDCKLYSLQCTVTVHCTVYSVLWLYVQCIVYSVHGDK